MAVTGQAVATVLIWGSWFLRHGLNGLWSQGAPLFLSKQTVMVSVVKGGVGAVGLINHFGPPWETH